MKKVLPIIAIILSSLTLLFSAFVLYLSVGCLTAPLGIIITLPFGLIALIAVAVCLILTLPFISNKLMRIALIITAVAALMLIGAAIIIFAFVPKAQ